MRAIRVCMRNCVPCMCLSAVKCILCSLLCDAYFGGRGDDKRGISKLIVSTCLVLSYLHDLHTHLTMHDSIQQSLSTGLPKLKTPASCQSTS